MQPSLVEVPDGKRAGQLPGGNDGDRCRGYLDLVAAGDFRATPETLRMQGPGGEALPVGSARNPVTYAKFSGDMAMMRSRSFSSSAKDTRR